MLQSCYEQFTSYKDFATAERIYYYAPVSATNVQHRHFACRASAMYKCIVSIYRMQTWFIHKNPSHTHNSTSICGRAVGCVHRFEIRIEREGEKPSENCRTNFYNVLFYCDWPMFFNFFIFFFDVEMCRIMAGKLSLLIFFLNVHSNFLSFVCNVFQMDGVLPYKTWLTQRHMKFGPTMYAIVLAPQQDTTSMFKRYTANIWFHVITSQVVDASINYFPLYFRVFVR